jgi:hypothetical protein
MSPTQNAKKAIESKTLKDVGLFGEATTSIDCLNNVLHVNGFKNCKISFTIEL